MLVGLFHVIIIMGGTTTTTTTLVSSHWDNVYRRLLAVMKEMKLSPSVSIVTHLCVFDGYLFDRRETICFSHSQHELRVLSLFVSYKKNKKQSLTFTFWCYQTKTNPLSPSPKIKCVVL